MYFRSRMLIAGVAFAGVMVSGASAAHASTSAPTLRYNKTTGAMSTGTGVKCVQLELNHHFGQKVIDPVDSKYGPQTARWVTLLQQEAFPNLGNPDGITGPITGQAIWNGIKLWGDPWALANCFQVLPTTSSTR